MVRDLSGVGPASSGHGVLYGSRPPFRAEPRPRGAPEFRLMTAADLAGGQTVRRPGERGQVNPDDFGLGQTVVHPQYGLGRIVAIDGEGSGRKGRVAFAIGPARTFVLAQSPLRPVASPRSAAARREPRANRRIE